MRTRSPWHLDARHTNTHTKNPRSRCTVKSIFDTPTTNLTAESWRRRSSHQSDYCRSPSPRQVVDSRHRTKRQCCYRRHRRLEPPPLRTARHSSPQKRRPLWLRRPGSRCGAASCWRRRRRSWRQSRTERRKTYGLWWGRRSWGAGSACWRCCGSPGIGLYSKRRNKGEMDYKWGYFSCTISMKMLWIIT